MPHFFISSVFIFLKILESKSHRFDNEGGKGTVFALDVLFNLLNNVIWETDAFIRRGWY